MLQKQQLKTTAIGAAAVAACTCDVSPKLSVPVDRFVESSVRGGNGGVWGNGNDGDDKAGGSSEMVAGGVDASELGCSGGCGTNGGGVEGGGGSGGEGGGGATIRGTTA